MYLNDLENKEPPRHLYSQCMVDLIIINHKFVFMLL